jgi:hypothetical protein
MSRVVSGAEQKNSTVLPSSKATKGLTALTSEMDCDQTAMNLPPVTSAVCLIAKSFWNILDVSATPSGIKSEWYL